jgi:hypothetical protein
MDLKFMIPGYDVFKPLLYRLMAQFHEIVFEWMRKSSFFVRRI